MKKSLNIAKINTQKQSIKLFLQTLGMHMSKQPIPNAKPAKSENLIYKTITITSMPASEIYLNVTHKET